MGRPLIRDVGTYLAQWEVIAMANDYVTFDEACELLGKTDSEVRALVAEGKLRELRDGNQIFFKKDDLNQIAAAEGSSIVDLAAAAEEFGDIPSAEGNAESFASALSSFKDESSSMGILDESPRAMPDDFGFDDEPKSEAPREAGSSFKLVQDDEDASPLVELTSDSFPEHLPAAKPEPTIHAAETPELTSEIDLLSDSDDASAGLSPLGGISPDIELSPAPQAEAAGGIDLEVPDFGLSGSSIISLEPDLDDAAPSPAKPAAGAGAGAKKGISVFDEDELQIDADPMGETRISSGMDELEAVGSGSGLLDITQESDDTSLGAALLDVISPTEGGGETAADESEPEIVSAEAEDTVEDSDAMVAVGEPGEGAYAEAAVAMPTVAAPRMAASVAVAGATPMNVTMILGLVALAITGLATAGQIQGVWPSFLDLVAKDVIHYSVFGGLAAIALGMGIWGILAGRK